jgi:hypothetical protein
MCNQESSGLASGDLRTMYDRTHRQFAFVQRERAQSSPVIHEASWSWPAKPDRRKTGAARLRGHRRSWRLIRRQGHGNVAFQQVKSCGRELRDCVSDGVARRRCSPSQAQQTDRGVA